MVIYETDRRDFDEKWLRRELRVVMYVSLHGFTRHTETGDITDGLFAIMQLGRAVRHGITAVYGTAEPPNVSISYSAHRALLSFPPSDAQRVVTCATAIFREMDQVNSARASANSSAASLLCKAGVAAGEVIVDLHAHACAAQEPVGEPVDKACQLANIARRWQVLVEQGYDQLVKDKDLSAVNGETGALEPRPGLDKRVKGYRDLVKVSAFTWSPGQVSTIYNPPILHSELEAIEEAVTEFLQQEYYVYPMTRRELEEGTVAAVAAAKDRVELLASTRRSKGSLRWIGSLARVRMTVNDSSEAKQELQIREAFVPLDEAYEQAKQSLVALAKASAQSQVDPGVWQADVNNCMEYVFGMFQAARNLLVVVNRLLRESE